jgi:hypothetical protein
MEGHHEIRVRPCGDGWAVECNDICQPIVFLSGGRAEQHGKTMAQRWRKLAMTSDYLSATVEAAWWRQDGILQFNPKAFGSR